MENSRRSGAPVALVQFVQQEERQRQDREGRGGFDRDRRRGEGRGRFGGEGGRRRGGRGGGRGRSGYGSVVDAGPVLLALSPAGELVVFKPNDEAYIEVARYPVTDEGPEVEDKVTYAYPVAVADSIYIKDRDSLTRWSVQ